MLIPGRTACLGGDITQLKIGTNHDFYNQQKVRSDMFIDIVNGKEQKPNKNIIKSLLSHPEDMAGIYSQSEDLNWLTINNPDLLFIDSFSELVDKKFTHKDGWSFCGSYGDFKNKCFTDGTLTDIGLLPINEIYNYYDLLFNYIKEKWNVLIIFMHFPTTFDNREIYINQGQAITNALSKLSLKYNIQNIHADQDAIEQCDTNPYHFTIKTIKNMSDKILL